MLPFEIFDDKNHFTAGKWFCQMSTNKITTVGGPQDISDYKIIYGGVIFCAFHDQEVPNITLNMFEIAWK